MGDQCVGSHCAAGVQFFFIGGGQVDNNECGRWGDPRYWLRLAQLNVDVVIKQYLKIELIVYKYAWEGRQVR